MHKSVLWIGLWCVVGVGVASCTSGQAGDTGAQPPADSPQVVAEINGSIACLNQTINEAVASRNRYLAWAGSGGPQSGGMVGAEQATLPMPRARLQGCQQAMEQARETPVLAPLDELLRSYLEAYEAVDTTLRAAHDYYQLQNYHDDAGQQAQRAHGELMTQWASLFAAEEVLRASLESEVNDRAERAIERLGAGDEGGLEALMRRQLKEARQLVSAFAAVRGGVSGERFAALETSLGAFQEAVDAGRKLSSSNPEIIRAARAQDSLEAAWAVFVQATRYMRALRKNKPTALGAQFDRESHNELVERYNVFVGATRAIRL